MALAQFPVRRTRVAPFSNALIDCCAFLVGLFALGRIVWHYPLLRLDAVVCFAVVVLILADQFLRIRRVYAAARPIALSAEDDTLAQALRELRRTFRWGCTMVLLLSMGVLFSWSFVH